MKMRILVAYAFLTGITIVYCALIWYASALFSVFFGTTEYGAASVFAYLSILPLPLSIWFGAVHWQLLAAASLVVSIVWGRRRASRIDSDEAYTLPMFFHLSWILLAILWHALGALSPMVMVGYSLG